MTLQPPPPSNTTNICPGLSHLMAREKGIATDADKAVIGDLYAGLHKVQQMVASLA